jgi:hypothetical protein
MPVWLFVKRVGEGFVLISWGKSSPHGLTAFSRIPPHRFYTGISHFNSQSSDYHPSSPLVRIIPPMPCECQVPPPSPLDRLKHPCPKLRHPESFSAASLGAVKRTRAAKVARIRTTDVSPSCWGVIHLLMNQWFSGQWLFIAVLV